MKPRSGSLVVAAFLVAGAVPRALALNLVGTWRGSVTCRQFSNAGDTERWKGFDSAVMTTT